MQLIVYIDDTLLLAEFEEKVQDQVSGLVYLLQCLGFMTNMDKSILEPAQSVEILGFTVNSDDAAKSSCRETKENLGGVLEIARGQASVNLCPLEINWKYECCRSGNPISPALLQTPPDGSGSSLKSFRSGLRVLTNPVSR